eukprot:12574889-Alexandrium_andersonii.AAC.1
MGPLFNLVSLAHLVSALLTVSVARRARAVGRFVERHVLESCSGSSTQKLFELCHQQICDASCPICGPRAFGTGLWSLAGH